MASLTNSKGIEAHIKKRGCHGDAVQEAEEDREEHPSQYLKVRRERVTQGRAGKHVEPRACIDPAREGNLVPQEALVADA